MYLYIVNKKQVINNGTCYSSLKTKFEMKRFAFVCLLFLTMLFIPPSTASPPVQNDAAAEMCSVEKHHAVNLIKVHFRTPLAADISIANFVLLPAVDWGIEGNCEMTFNDNQFSGFFAKALFRSPLYWFSKTNRVLVADLTSYRQSASSTNT